MGVQFITSGRLEIREPQRAANKAPPPRPWKQESFATHSGKKHTIGCTWMYWVRPLFALRCAKTIRNRALICSCRAFFLPIPSGLTDPFGVDKVRHPQIHLSIGGPRAQPGKSSGCLRISLTLSAGKSLTRTHLSWCKHGNYVHAQCWGALQWFVSGFSMVWVKHHWMHRMPMSRRNIPVRHRHAAEIYGPVAAKSFEARGAGQNPAEG